MRVLWLSAPPGGEALCLARSGARTSMACLSVWMAWAREGLLLGVIATAAAVGACLRSDQWAPPECKRTGQTVGSMRVCLGPCRAYATCAVNVCHAVAAAASQPTLTRRATAPGDLLLQPAAEDAITKITTAAGGAANLSARACGRLAAEAATDAAKLL